MSYKSYSVFLALLCFALCRMVEPAEADIEASPVETNNTDLGVEKNDTINIKETTVSNQETENQVLNVEVKDAKSLDCYVCANFPNNPWKSDKDIDCHAPLNAKNKKQYVRDCHDVLNVTGEGRYRCTTTIGVGIDEEPFYIRGCEFSKKDYGECVKEFDLATTCYCIPALCNGSKSLIVKNILCVTLHIAYHIILLFNTNVF